MMIKIIKTGNCGLPIVIRYLKKRVLHIIIISLFYNCVGICVKHTYSLVIYICSYAECKALRNAKTDLINNSSSERLSQPEIKAGISGSRGDRVYVKTPEIVNQALDLMRS